MDTLAARKEGKYLIFELPPDKSCKYDLSTGKTYGFSGKEVKSINSQLRGYNVNNVIESFPDEKYRKFLEFVYLKGARYNGVTNTGTFLECLKSYSLCEQYFSAGLALLNKITIPIKEVPKWLLDYCRSTNTLISNEMIRTYKDNPGRFQLLTSLELESFTPRQIIEEYVESFTYYRKGLRYGAALMVLINDYNYSIQHLHQYIDYLASYEAIAFDLYTFYQEIKDYAFQSSKLSPNYEKYPRNFLTTHQITIRNYKRLSEKFDEELFFKIYSQHHSRYEMNIKDYTFIYPKTIQDIKDEAVQQSNCVASYISSVLSGKCHIIFLRNKKTPQKSLVTCEVLCNKITQAKGSYNRPVTEVEQEAISLWEEAVA